MAEVAFVDLPKDWRVFHLDNIRRLDRAKVLGAVEFLKGAAPAAELDRLRPIAAADPEWWTAHHFGAMMAVRNMLRRAGFGETDLGVDNLDDYAVGMVELALGVVEL
jgi:hypothetical protein